MRHAIRVHCLERFRPCRYGNVAPQDPWIELRAHAKSLGREPAAQAAELLAAAVSDAKSYLDEDGAEAMARSRRELLVEELPEQQPGVAFDAGAP